MELESNWAGALFLLLAIVVVDAKKGEQQRNER